MPRHFKITTSPRRENLTAWFWTLRYVGLDGDGKVIESGNSYKSADAAKQAAEEYADSIAAVMNATQTHTYTPGGESS